LNWFPLLLVNSAEAKSFQVSKSCPAASEDLLEQVSCPSSQGSNSKWVFKVEHENWTPALALCLKQIFSLRLKLFFKANACLFSKLRDTGSLLLETCILDLGNIVFAISQILAGRGAKGVQF